MEQVPRLGRSACSPNRETVKRNEESNTSRIGIGGGGIRKVFAIGQVRTEDILNPLVDF